MNDFILLNFRHFFSILGQNPLWFTVTILYGISGMTKVIIRSKDLTMIVIFYTDRSCEDGTVSALTGLFEIISEILGDNLIIFVLSSLPSSITSVVILYIPLNFLNITCLLSLSAYLLTKISYPLLTTLL
ncbi:hypothetical protein GLOIN_2v1613821 [Rhizophagus irregularis DAOM 181602=DAOM 197198]|uniref:Uncharacterized protein n=1 Tax=Rhizophagus irregularis (strain DAOM 181602 / DAOM 197198 / MUCL 43194) TaxID=747089 RepID=A0A2P4PZ93_RHIID|nr:hypothetical protein GLOIN_2v1613821 [Rhizophagus irregularis DAOM 181602=DAOM 197198]POG70699.1 hypothetical protein GLOIN_2v1613821 [Rhizophagus irregularis DAOM 181602=DAOM 197198]|eukprot:XP_025177565.1 hypothetical protein GLOIN_2v1613821 [Rhizophagus irregularis DAOM 181602=DAOM 197198]